MYQGYTESNEVLQARWELMKARADAAARAKAGQAEADETPKTETE
jgi:hypothetical protein